MFPFQNSGGKELWVIIKGYFGHQVKSKRFGSVYGGGYLVYGCKAKLQLQVNNTLQRRRFEEHLQRLKKVAQGASMASKVASLGSMAVNAAKVLTALDGQKSLSSDVEKRLQVNQVKEINRSWIPQGSNKSINLITGQIRYSTTSAEMIDPVGTILLPIRKVGWALKLLGRGGEVAAEGGLKLLGPGLDIVENKLVQHAADWGIANKGVALTTEQMGMMRKLANHIYNTASEMRQGVWGNPAAGGFKDALYYSNGKHLVVTQNNGTMITILRNAMGNKNFDKAVTIWKH